MYNGIGLTTARGSGTSGYVQQNKFHRDASRLTREAPDGGLKRAREAEGGSSRAPVARRERRDISAQRETGD